MSFRIRGLQPAQFRPLFALDDATLLERGMRAMIIDEPNSAPCRVALRDVEPGERVLLLQYAHQLANTPYRSGGPIFISEHSSEPFDRIDVLPQMFSNRPLSVRAYDGEGMMVTADVAHADPRLLFKEFFSDSSVEYVHVHLARRGCYACRVERG